jgi:hypothetical protein
MRNVTALIATALFAATVALPASGGASTTYRVSKYVDLRGMTVVAPAGWKFHESTGEVALWARDYRPGPGTGAFVAFFTDPYGTLSASSSAIASVRTPPALADFLLHHHPKLIASPVPARRIGGITALGVDLRVSPDAAKEDPHCAVACASYLRFQHGCCIGTDSNTWVRAYFATIGRGKKHHVLLVLIEGDPQSAFTRALPTAQKILNSVKLPVR